jgi:hypothetical protein
VNEVGRNIWWEGGGCKKYGTVVKLVVENLWICWILSG